MGGSQPTLPLHDEDQRCDDDDDVCGQWVRTIQPALTLPFHDDDDDDDDDEEEDEAQNGLVQILGHTGDTEAPGVWRKMRSRFIQPSNVIFLRI